MENRDDEFKFINALLISAPDLKRVYEDHRNVGGQVLPHVLMGDITRFLIALHAKEVTSNIKSPALYECLVLFEKGMKFGTDSVQELISVSFLENLFQSDDLYYSLRDKLGPSLRTELAFYEDEDGTAPEAPELPNAENPLIQNAIRDFFPGRKPQ